MKVKRAPVPTKSSLKEEPYIGPSQIWATVTPYVFDRFPKDQPGKDERSIISNACQRIGLPTPSEIRILDVSPFIGVPHVSDFYVPSEAHFYKRPRKHLVLRFDERVRGPIVIGGGRYYGFGLHRKIER